MVTRDEKYRPIIMLSLKNFPLPRLESEEIEIIESFVYFIKVVREFLLLPYFVETFKVVVDMAGQDPLPFANVFFGHFLPIFESRASRELF